MDLRNSEESISTSKMILGIVFAVYLLIKYLSGSNKNEKIKTSTDTVTLTDLLGDYAPYIEL